LIHFYKRFLWLREDSIDQLEVPSQEGEQC